MLYRRLAVPNLTLAFALLLGLLVGATVLPHAAQAQTLPTYRIDATLDVDGAALRARQVVSFKNAVGKPLESAVFRAYPSIVGGLRLESSAVDSQAREARIDGSVLEVPLGAPLAPGSSTEIELRYAINLPRRAERLSDTPRAVALGSWYPILAVHRGDWDRRQFVDVGDAFFSAAADYDVTITTSRPLELAATGQLVERDDLRWRFIAHGVRDFAIAGSTGYAVRSVQTGATTVNAYALTAARAQQWAESGADLVSWYGEHFGAYPYPSLAIAEVDLPASYGGLEYPALVMLSAQIGRASCRERV